MFQKKTLRERELFVLIKLLDIVTLFKIKTLL